MHYYLEFTDESSAKFWSLAVSGSFHTLTFGKIGTSGQTKVKAFSSPQEAERAAEKLVTAKLKKGYVETTRPPEFAVRDAPAPTDQPATGPAPVSDDGSAKPWFDTDAEPCFAFERLAAPEGTAASDTVTADAVPDAALDSEGDSLSSTSCVPSIDLGRDPSRGVMGPGWANELGAACLSGEVEHAQQLLTAGPEPTQAPEAIRSVLDQVLADLLGTGRYSPGLGRIVALLLGAGASVPAPELWAGDSGLRKYFFKHYSKDPRPARAAEIVAKYFAKRTAKLTAKLEQRVAEYQALDTADERRRQRWTGFAGLLDESTRQDLGIPDEDAEVPAPFYPFWLDALHRDPTPGQISTIWESYLDYAFDIGIQELATWLRDYAQALRSGDRQTPGRKYLWLPDEDHFASDCVGLEFAVPNEYWTYVYVRGEESHNIFDVKTPEISGLTTHYLARYSDRLRAQLQQLASEGVFDGLFASGIVLMKLRDEPDALLIYTDGQAASPAQTIAELEQSTDPDSDTPEMLRWFPLLLHGVLGAPDVERAYGLLLHFLYGVRDGAAEDKIVNQMIRWEDAYPRIKYELARWQRATLQPDRSRSYAQAAKQAGYPGAAELLAQLDRDAKVRSILSHGGGPAVAVPARFDVIEAAHRWKHQNFDEQFDASELYLETPNVVVRASRDGHLWVRFLVEGDVAYGEVLDFVNPLLEKGYAALSGGSSKGIAWHVRFLRQPEYLGLLDTETNADGESYPHTDANAFFARAVQYPLVRSKVADYAERALIRFHNYLDLGDESGTVPGTFAVAALLFSDPSYFYLAQTFADACDSDHTYLHVCLIPALVKHWGEDPRLGAPIAALALLNTFDRVYELPTAFIWSAEFMAAFLQTGGAGLDDHAGLEQFALRCEHIFADDAEATLRKLRRLAKSSTVHADFYHTYLEAAKVWEGDDFDEFKPIPTTPDPATGAPDNELCDQEAVISVVEAAQRGYSIEEPFPEKVMILVVPAGTHDPATLAYAKTQWSNVGRENSKSMSDRRCRVLLQSGSSVFQFGEWVINTDDLKSECCLLLYGGRRTKPVILYGELDAIGIGIACTKRWPKTTQAAESYRRQFLIRDSGPRLKGPEWAAAESFLEEDANTGDFYSEWHHAIARRQLERVGPAQGQLTYLFARMMLAYLAERSGDAESLVELAAELVTLAPEYAEYWSNKRDLARVAQAAT